MHIKQYQKMASSIKKDTSLNQMSCSDTESNEYSESYAENNDHKRSNSNDIEQNANVKFDNHSNYINLNIYVRNSNFQQNLVITVIQIYVNRR